MARVSTTCAHRLFALALVSSLAGCYIVPARPYYPAQPYPGQQGPVGGEIYSAPPAPQQEVYGPPPSPGYIWIGGFWNWNLGRHIWIGGHWSAPRPGHYWEPHRWERHGQGWRMNEGHWARR